MAGITKYCVKMVALYLEIVHICPTNVEFKEHVLPNKSIVEPVKVVQQN